MSNEVNDLEKDITFLQQKLESQQDYRQAKVALSDWLADNPDEIPLHGNSAKTVKNVIHNHKSLDFKPQLNTSSYVNVIFEPEEEEVAMMGLSVNLADQTVYPPSYKIHDMVVNMLAKLKESP